MLRDTRLRFAGLLAAGSLAVHQVRYSVGYGADAARALEDQGHGYLGAAGTLAGLVLALALGSFLGAMLRGRPAGGTQPRLRALWLAATAALSVIYAGQELIEGALTSGHPGGVAAVFGHGGSIAFVAAAAIGALIALALRGATAALEVAAARRRLLPPQLPAPPATIASSPLIRLAPATSGAHGARGPPSPSR